MTKPLYVQAFEHFRTNDTDLLRAYVSFGLYIEAECKWAASQATWPTNAKYREWFDCSFPYTTGTHFEKATQVLEAFANNIAEQERSEFLKAALKEYKVEAAKSEKGFLRGVAEALTGAFVWSLILIALSIIIQRVGIDLLEVYQRAAGIHGH